ncbi:MAG: tRNA (cytidine(34)-2'-O)-methyltransferase [Planctomycetota bacterium]|jgi:tRNA (cytidine/uridine-2'-O-)-methyltransferase
MDHVVLVEPEIPWNTGIAGRSCLAFGAQLHLVEPLGFSLSEKMVRRAGVDYWSDVRPKVHASWSACEARLPDLGEIWMLSAEAPRALDELELAGPAVFVFGSESRGLDPGIRERHAERLVRIPMLDDRVRSLNLSTTVGITLYAASLLRSR